MMKHDMKTREAHTNPHRSLGGRLRAESKVVFRDPPHRLRERVLAGLDEPVGLYFDPASMGGRRWPSRARWFGAAAAGLAAMAALTASLVQFSRSSRDVGDNTVAVVPGDSETSPPIASHSELQAVEAPEGSAPVRVYSAEGLAELVLESSAKLDQAARVRWTDELRNIASDGFDLANTLAEPLPIRINLNAASASSDSGG